MDKFKPNRLLSYDDNSLSEELKRVYFKHFEGQQMTTKEFTKLSRVSARTVTERFGSWNNALKAAGIEIYNEISKPIIKNDIEKIIQINQGQYITFVFYKQNGGKFSESTFKRYFEGKKWAEILASEFSLYPIRNIIIVDKQVEEKTEEQLFDEIRKIWNKIGRRPTYSEFRKNASFGTKIYEKKYGSWTKAIEAFCLLNSDYYSGSIDKGFNTTKDLLIQELQRIKEAHKLEVLEQDDYKKYGGQYSVQTYHNHFGSWKKALLTVGLKSGRSAPTKAELFNELQKVWEELGRQPSQTEITKYCQYKYSSYTHVFGSWTKAIYSFIEYMQDDTEDEMVQENIDTKTVEPNNKKEIVIQSNNNYKNANVIKMKTPRTVSNRLRFKVFLRDNFTCQYCGKTLLDRIKLEADHIIAYSNGGETTLENLKTACWTCNNGKSNEQL